eukprot:1764641-Alexandrium_andersonii.AAC.1
MRIHGAIFYTHGIEHRLAVSEGTQRAECRVLHLLDAAAAVPALVEQASQVDAVAHCLAGAQHLRGE